MGVQVRDRRIYQLADAADDTVAGAQMVAELHAAMGNYDRAAEWTAASEILRELREGEHGGRNTAA